MDDGLPRLDLVGHPALRATHGKTLEFTVDPDVTERATCVLGVAGRVTGGAVAGPVRITIDAGGAVATVDAIANPDWAGGTAVVRRGTDRRPDTFATEATAAAADLPRELVARIIDPDTPITVRCSRLPRRPDGRAGLVLAWTAPGAPAAPRLAAELVAADAVVAEDADAARVAGERTIRAADAVTGLLDGELGRVLVVATAGLPGASVTAALEAPEKVAVEVAGLPAALVAAAGSPVRGPVQLAEGRSRIDAVLRSAPPEVTLVVTVAAADLPRLLERAADRRGTRTATVVDPAAGGVVRWGPVGRLRAGRTSGELVCALDGAADTVLGPELAAFVRGLLAAGVSARTAAHALAQVPGWSRRSAYDAVLGLTGD
ncbi:hypothetical protein SAMN05443637_101340 [Pseudonocardia thermophila]|uniref:Uncharacterized protein n=1 Tax=Pseudonocardia thermophila TaxID=1848 RepID=A0A1M6NM16_PSETH|nr:DUF371 domain-containing protein [Pseudonocardia thermophila]SHJ96797.1 hypothetical protein SAMN05443637_101340 [Pseudonocardia thermophila]